MSMEIFTSLILYIFLEIVCMSIGIRILSRDMESPLNLAFFTMNTLLFLFTTLSTVLFFAEDINLVLTITRWRWVIFIFLNMGVVYFFFTIYNKKVILYPVKSLLLAFLFALMPIYFTVPEFDKGYEFVLNDLTLFNIENYNYMLFLDDGLSSPTIVYLLFCHILITLIVVKFFIDKKNYKNFYEEYKIIAFSFFIYSVLLFVMMYIFFKFNILQFEILSLIFLVIDLAVLYCTIYHNFLISQNQLLLLKIFTILKEGLILTDSEERIFFMNNHAKNSLGINDKSYLKLKIRNLIENATGKNYLDIKFDSNKQARFQNKFGDTYSFKFNNVYDKYSHVYIKIFTLREINAIKELEDSLSKNQKLLENQINKKNNELLSINKDLHKQAAILKDVNYKLTQKTYYDNLTNLPNRRRITPIVNKILNKGTELGMVYFDLINFRRINNNFGYHYGDKVLIMVSERLKLIMKKTEMLSRISGDEFVIIFPYSTEREREITIELENSFKEPFILDTFSIFIDLKLGLAHSDINIRTFKSLLRASNLALNKAKSENTSYQIYSPEYEAELVDRALKIKSIRNAIDNKQFEIFLQPQVNCKTEKIQGAEALIRWKHPEKGLLSPGYFIPFCEKENLIVEIDTLMMEMGTDLIKHFESINKLDPLPISINLSVKHLESSNVIELIRKNLIRTNINPSHLKIEFTESFSPESIKEPEKTLNYIKESLGVNLSIDDFGVDYATYMYIKKIKASYLKIDMSYVRNIGDDHYNTAIDSLISLSKNLNMKTVAEGVETKEQALYLKGKGADLIQGYYYYKPMSVEDLEEIL